jgi:hypothetical protein
MPQIDVWVIDAFEGPRHDRLKAIWKEYARQHAAQMCLRIFPNIDGRLSHGECLEKIWKKAKADPTDRVIITEFDFLPAPEMVQWPWQELTLREPVHAAEYCTRDARTKQMHLHGIPGAWFIRISKPLLNGHLLYMPGGKFNDPCNLLSLALRESTASRQHVRLLETVECYPRHYGVRVLGAGEHLFWSRHYNDNPAARPAGFSLYDILSGVDKAIDEYEAELQNNA